MDALLIETNNYNFFVFYLIFFVFYYNIYNLFLYFNLLILLYFITIITACHRVKKIMIFSYFSHTIVSTLWAMKPKNTSCWKRVTKRITMLAELDAFDVRVKIPWPLNCLKNWKFLGRNKVRELTLGNYLITQLFLICQHFGSVILEIVSIRKIYTKTIRLFSLDFYKR